MGYSSTFELFKISLISIQLKNKLTKLHIKIENHDK